MSLFIKKKKQETNPKEAWKRLTLRHSDGVIAFNIYIFHPFYSITIVISSSPAPVSYLIPWSRCNLFCIKLYLKKKM